MCLLKFTFKIYLVKKKDYFVIVSKKNGLASNDYKMEAKQTQTAVWVKGKMYEKII